jgi:diguanylate cyclase (GGDEF)-like protein
MPTFDKDQQPLFAREGLFRQKLNQLRTGENNNPRTPPDSSTRFKELEQGSYLTNVQTSMAKGDPQEKERIALLDGSTELYNRTAITRIIRDELKRSKRYKHNLSLLVVSIDEFASISQKHGATTTDSIIKGVATFLMSIIRDVDIPARYDGNTFLVLCPDTEPKGVSVLAERIRSKIMLTRVSDVGQNWHVTVSQGIAGFPGASVKGEELIQNAIMAANTAQKNGGNQTVLAE